MIQVTRSSEFSFFLFNFHQFQFLVSVKIGIHRDSRSCSLIFISSLMQRHKDNHFVQKPRHGYNAAVTPSMQNESPNQGIEYQPVFDVDDEEDDYILDANDDDVDPNEYFHFDSYEGNIQHHSNAPFEGDYELSESGLTNQMHALSQSNNLHYNIDQRGTDQQQPFDVNLPAREYLAHQLPSPHPEEGLSSLQTRLQSFQVQTTTQRQLAQPPAAQLPTATTGTQDHFMQDYNFSSSPTPNHSHSAQPSNLGPISVPVELEFTAPTDYLPMMGTNRRADSSLAQLPVTSIRRWNVSRLFEYHNATFFPLQPPLFEIFFISDTSTKLNLLPFEIYI